MVNNNSMIWKKETFHADSNKIFSAFWSQKFPDEGLANVVKNVFDFDSYNKEVKESIVSTLHKHGIPVGAHPTNINLVKE